MATAPASAQAHLLEVQSFDTRLVQIAHARANLPQQQRLLEIAQESERIGDLLIAARTNASDISREQTRADNDVQLVVQRIERDQSMLNSGSLAAKELESLQHELQSLARRKSELEDVELQIMERLEEANAAAADFQSQLDVLAAEQADLGEQVKAALGEMATEAADVAQRRADVASSIPADLMALYEKVRGDNPTAAALLQRGACTGCRISLPATELSKVRESDPDQIVRCDNCRCILVRTAESGL